MFHLPSNQSLKAIPKRVRVEPLFGADLKQNDHITICTQDGYLLSPEDSNFYQQDQLKTIESLFDPLDQSHRVLGHAGMMTARNDFDGKFGGVPFAGASNPGTGGGSFLGEIDGGRNRERTKMIETIGEEIDRIFQAIENLPVFFADIGYDGQRVVPALGFAMPRRRQRVAYLLAGDLFNQRARETAYRSK